MSATVIDLFAGMGGSSQGAHRAGFKTVWAGNHWSMACDFFEANMGLRPKCQDLQQADWREVPEHDIMLASPACQGHSIAKGKERPHHDALRSTAWAVVACAEYHREQVLVVENVPEFLNWSLYPSWCDALKRLGYSVSPHILDAADSGVPQHRVRVFVVCTRSEAPIKLKLPKRPHVPINSVIEWDEHNWSPIDRPGRSAATLARVAAGRKRFGDRFVAPFYGSGSGETGRSIHRPIGTLTTRDRWAVISGNFMRVLQPPENLKAMSFDRDTKVPRVKKDAMHLIGNAVAPNQMFDICTALKEAA